MSTTHHLNEQFQIGYAAGVLPEAFNLVIACHLCLSDESRASQCCYDAIGGAVLTKCDKETMSVGALSATLQQIKTCPCDTSAPEICTGILPQPLQSYTGGNLEAVRWRSLGNGIRQAVIPTAKGAVVRLLFVPAGQAIPNHGQKGTELTLVLQGSYLDHGKQYSRGDIEITAPNTEHHPIAETGQDCICLSATDTPIAFANWRNKFLRLLSRH